MGVRSTIGYERGTYCRLRRRCNTETTFVTPAAEAPHYSAQPIPLQVLRRQLDVAPVLRVEGVNRCQHVFLVGALPRRRTLQGRDKLTPRSDVGVPLLHRRHVREDELQPTRWLRDGSQGRAQRDMEIRNVEAPPIIALR